MALKSDRLYITTTIKHFMNEVAEAGGIATLSTAGSGAATDQSRNLVTYSATNSGKVPVGLLVNDMVNQNLTKFKLNPHRYEVQKGGKVELARDGFWLTNYIVPGQTIVGGTPAYVGPSGKFSNVMDPGSFMVGQFETTKDEDGYAEINLHIPGPRPVAGPAGVAQA